MHIYQCVFWWCGTGKLGSNARVPSIHNLRFFPKRHSKEGPPWGGGGGGCSSGGWFYRCGAECTAVYFFFFESFLIEKKNVNVLSFIPAAECSAS